MYNLEKVMSKRINKVVVVLSHLPWDFPCDYIKQTSLELAKKSRVIVFSPLNFPTLKQVLFDRGIRENFLLQFKEKKVCSFPSLAYIPFRRIDFVRKLNLNLNLLFFRFFYRLKFGNISPVFWAFSYQLSEIANFFSWGRTLVYDRVDQIASLDAEEDKIARRQDRVLLKAADFVFTNSPYGLDYIKKFNRNSFLVPCGCNVDLFLGKRPKTPKELAAIKSPKIGLVGSIDHRVNFKILYSLAKKRKDWNFVFVGKPFSDQFAQFEAVRLKEKVAKFKSFANVFFLGQKPKERMPEFIGAFDVCLIPYDASQEFVKGCNPMKLYEYLAMGKPVVSCPIEAVKVYSPTVAIADSTADFEKAIEGFLKQADDQETKERRIKIARDNSWEEKIGMMWDKLDN